MRFACWITKDTDTHSEYVILSIFAQQQWLRESATLFRLKLHCLFYYTKIYQSTIYTGDSYQRVGRSIKYQPVRSEHPPHCPDRTDSPPLLTPAGEVQTLRLDIKDVSHYVTLHVRLCH
jgi:hypothetical protein